MTAGERHPDFEPQNRLAVTHGAFSERAIIERAEQVHERLLLAAPWLSEDKYLPAVSLYLRSAARSSLLDEYVERVAAEKGIEHVPSRTVEQAIAASNRAFTQAEALGLTPGGHAKLKVLVAGAAQAEDAYGALQKHLQSTYGEGDDVDG
jgi:hypothetical protein